MGIVAKGCGVCDRRLSPTLPRSNRRHIAVRFGPFDSCVQITLHGTPIMDTFEAVTGKDGWALRYTMPVRFCDCGSDEPECYLDESDGYGWEWPKTMPPEGLTALWDQLEASES